MIVIPKNSILIGGVHRAAGEPVEVDDADGRFVVREGMAVEVKEEQEPDQEKEPVKEPVQEPAPAAAEQAKEPAAPEPVKVVTPAKGAGKKK